MVVFDPLLWPLGSPLWGQRLLRHVVDGIERGFVGLNPTWGSLRHSWCWWILLVSGAVGITIRGATHSPLAGNARRRPLTKDDAEGPER